MAYSNWGAFIYNEEKDITDKCGDRTYVFKNNRWTLENDNEYNEDCKRVGAHAVVPITDTLLIECYKTYINLHTPNNTINITKEVLEEVSFEYDDFKIMGYYVNKDENIVKLTVSKDEVGDLYCIIFGMSIGKGYEKTPMSKYIKKHLYYNEEYRCYIWNEPEMTDYAIEKAERKYEIEHIRYWLFHSHLKSFFKRLFCLDFQNLYIEWDDVKEDLKKIKYLR